MTDRPGNARRILALRTLLIAWVHNPGASTYRLLVEALAVGAQYEPPVSTRELASLWPMISELFGPLPKRLPHPEVTDVRQG